MARTPSLSIADAEALIGQRGSVSVSALNRAQVRKWFTARGLPALFVGGLSMRELEYSYNDTTDATWNKLQNKFNEAREAIEADGEDAAYNEQLKAEAAPMASSATKFNGHAPNDDATALVSLLQKLAGQSVNAEQVKAIVDETLLSSIHELKAKLTHRVEIVSPDRDPVIVDGAHPNFPTLARAASARDANGYHLNIFLAGEASSGKTTACKQLATALGRDWYFNGAISMPHEMLGFIDAGGQYHRTAFRNAYENGGVYTFDEVDRSDAVALLSVNPHLANGVATFPDGQIKRHKDCLIICTANTWGQGANADYVGATKLDAAFMSRFPVRIAWNIDREFEMRLSGNEDWCKRVQAARDKAQRAGLKVMIDVRMTLAGAALIAAGFSPDDAAAQTYLANLTQAQKDMLS